MAEPNPISSILLIVLTIIFPPLGVFLITGCNADLLINACLTLLGYFPGHIHAFYLEYVFFSRRSKNTPLGAGEGHAPGIYSDRVQRGEGTEYGTI